MSGLSAKTYSCGGEGARFGGGDSDSFLKYLVMPTGSSTAMGADSSSDGGADDSDERSESESDMLDMFAEVGSGCVEKERRWASARRKKFYCTTTAD